MSTEDRPSRAFRLFQLDRLPEALAEFPAVAAEAPWPVALVARQGRAGVLFALLRFRAFPAEARAAHREILAVRTHVLGPDHPDTRRSVVAAASGGLRPPESSVVAGGDSSGANGTVVDKSAAWTRVRVPLVHGPEAAASG